MNAIDAAHATVHDYPGGSESLAPRMGMSAAVLRGKVNPNNPRNHLTLAEAERLMQVTNDVRMLQAMAMQTGYTLTPCHVEPPPPTETLASMLLQESAAAGEFARTIHDALADDIISEREMREIVNAEMGSQRAVMTLLQRLREMTGKRVQA